MCVCVRERERERETETETERGRERERREEEMREEKHGSWFAKGVCSLGRSPEIWRLGSKGN